MPKNDVFLKRSEKKSGPFDRKTFLQLNRKVERQQLTLGEY